LHPEATGELSNLLYDICLAAKIISRQVRRAGLTDILGEFGAINVQGEVQQKLDVFANETVRHAVEHTGRVCVVASEEDEHPILVYTTGQGVHGFTLDPTIGEFLLSHPDIRSPDVGTYYSVNESHWNKWAPGIQRVVAAFKNGDGGRVEAKNARYIGSLVADI